MGKIIVPKEQRKASKSRKKIEGVLLQELGKVMRERPQPRFLEVGAHIGKMIEFIYECNDGAEVYAIEPLDSNIKKLLQRFPARNITVFKGLVSSTVGKKNLFLSNIKTKNKNMDCSMYKESVEKNNADIKNIIAENAYTMEHIWKELKLSHIDLISMNCEGGEYDIFESDNMEFLDNTDMIFICMHTKSKLFLSEEYRKKRMRIMDILANRGFVMQGMKDVGALAHVVQLWRKK